MTDRGARAGADEPRRPAVTPRALVLGERGAVALTACRALGRAGYDVGVTNWRQSEAALSRHAFRSYRIPAIENGVDDWSGRVRAIVASEGYNVILATTDVAVAAFPYVQLSVPTCPQVSVRHLALIDKALLADLCRVASVEYPRTDQPRTDDEDDAAARRVRGPMIVKAARSALLLEDTVVHLPGAHVVGDPLSARAALRSIRRRGLQPIVQEYLEGDKLQAVILRRAETTSCRLAYRVVREYPLERGDEAMLEAVRATDGIGAEMVAMLERLADATGYEGLLQAEFLRNRENGRLRVIDVNPRLWGSLRFAEMLGFRMTERVMQDALGLSTPPEPPDPGGRRYHHLVRELRWVRAKGHVPAGYLASYAPRDVWDTPSLTDPLPELLRLKRIWNGRPARKTSDG